MKALAMLAGNNKNKSTKRAINDSYLPLKVKFADLTFNMYHLPFYLQIFMAILPHIQLSAQLLSHQSVYSPYNEPIEKISSAILQLAKAIDLGRLLDFTEKIGIAYFFSILTIIIWFFSMSAFFYSLWFAYKGNLGRTFATSYWSLIAQVHSTLICFFAGSFLTNLLRASYRGDLNIAASSAGNIFFTVVGVFLLLANYLTPSFIMFFYHPVLPSKNLAACKDNLQEFLKLFQLGLNGLLFIFMDEKSASSVWISIAVNFFLAAVQQSHFYITLPYYNLHMLFLRANMSVLDSVFILLLAVKQVLSLKAGLVFVVMISPIIYLFASRLLVGWLVDSFMQLVFSPMEKINSHKIVHKINFVRQIRSNNKSINLERKLINFWTLLYEAIGLKIKQIFQIDPSFALSGLGSFECKTTSNQVFTIFLEKAVELHPTCEYLKIYLAYYYASKQKLYAKAMNLIEEVRRSTPSYNLSLTIEILRIRIQERIIMGQSANNYLDLDTYLKHLRLYKSMRNDMLQQAEYQIKFCSEFLKDTPDAYCLYDLGKKVDNKKRLVAKKFKKLESISEEYFMDPVVSYSYYHLALNHHPYEGQKYIELFSKKMIKYRRRFDKEELIKENCFNEDNIFITISASREQNGIIVQSSKSTERVLGYETQFLVGTNVYGIMPPFYKEIHQKFMDRYMDTGKSVVLNTTHIAFAQHREGHLIPLSSFLTVHPYLHSGLYFSAIMKPMNKSRDYILVNPKGYIDSFSKNIGQLLGLYTRRNFPTHISLLNEEFNKINQILDAYAHSKFIPGDTLESKKDDRKSDMEISDINNTHRRLLDTSNISTHRSNAYGKATLFGGDSSFINARTERDDLIEHAFTLHASEKEIGEMYDDISKQGKEYFLNKIHTPNENIELFGKFSVLMHTGNYYLKVFVFDKSKESANMINEGTFPREISMKKEREPSKFSKKGPSVAPDLLQSAVFGSENEFENETTPQKIMEKHNFTDLLVLEGKEEDQEQEPEENLSALDIKEKKSRNVNDAIQFIVNSSRPLNQTFEDPPSLPKFNNDSRIHSKLIKQFLIQNKSDDDRKEDQIEEYKIKMSQGTVSSTNYRVFNAITGSLESPFYNTKFELILFFILIGIVVITLIQIDSEKIMIGVMDNYSSYATSLREAEHRYALLSDANRFIRLLHLILIQRFSLQELNTLYNDTLSVSIGRLTTAIDDLITINNDMIKTTHNLDDETRKNWFSRDVKIYDNYYYAPQQPYVNLSNFQATQALIDIGLEILLDYSIVPPTKYQFFFRNAINDLLINSESSTSAIKASLDYYVDNKKDKLTTFYVAELVAYVFMLLMAAYAYNIQYKRTKNNIDMILRLPDGVIEAMRTEFGRFKTLVDSEEYSAQISLIGSKDFQKLYTDRKFDTKQKKFRELKTHKLQKKFILYFLFFCAFFIAQEGISQTKFSVYFSSSSYLRNTLNRVIFADKIRSDVGYTMVCFAEFMSENATTFAKNLPIIDEAPDQINTLGKIANDLVTVLREDDQSYDPYISSILFDNICSLLSEPNKAVCSSFQADSTSFGLIEIITRTKNSLSFCYDRYENSAKQISDLKSIQFYGISTASRFAAIVTEITAILGDYINNKYDNRINSIKLELSIFYAICYVLPIILVFSIYTFSLKNLREIDNCLKKVLKIIPISVLMNNLSIKTYIINTSRGNLNYIKKDI